MNGPEGTPAGGASRPSGRISLGLRELLEARPEADFQIRDLFVHLSGRGHATLMVVMAIPLLLPVPFGPVIGPILIFVGLRFAFGSRPWLPAWVLRKPLRRATVLRLAEKCQAIERRTARLLRPRYTTVCRNVWIHRMLGLTVATLGLLLPLPIPFTNVPLAVLVLIIGLALIEDDGLVAMIGLSLSVLTFLAVGLATWFGSGAVHDLVSGWFGG